MTAYQFQMSIVSLMSKPINYDSTKFKFDSKVSENSSWHLRTELNKRFLNDLVLAQPHYLIVDFYTDLTFGFRKVGEQSYITNKKSVFEKNKLWDSLDLGEEYSVESNHRNFYKIFKQAVDDFVVFCDKNLKNTTIVVNQARYTNEYWDSVNRKITTFGNKTPGHYDQLNILWSKLDNYLIEKPNVKCISYDKKYYADPNYRYGGLHTVHYKNNFYEDFLKKMLALTFDDLMNQKVNLELSDEDGNYIQNSNFLLGNSSWQIFNSEVFNIENGKVLVNSQGNIENKWNQMVSDPIEIKEDKDYYISFDFEGIDLSEIGNSDPILKLRTFMKRNEFKAKDAVQEIDITKIEILQQISSNDERFSKKFKLEGKYVKVIPYLKRNGTYTITKLQLSHFDGSYQLALNEQ